MAQTETPGNGTNGASAFTRPSGDAALAGAIVVGAIVALLLLARAFRAVAPG